MDLPYKYFGSIIPTFLRITLQCAKGRTSTFCKSETTQSFLKRKTILNSCKHFGQIFLTLSLKKMMKTIHWNKLRNHRIKMKGTHKHQQVQLQKNLPLPSKHLQMFHMLKCFSVTSQMKAVPKADSNRKRSCHCTS